MEEKKKKSTPAETPAKAPEAPTTPSPETEEAKKTRKAKAPKDGTSPQKNGDGKKHDIFSVIAALQEKVSIGKKEQVAVDGRVFTTWTIDDLLNVLKPIYLDMGAVMWFDDTVAIFDKIPYVNTTLHLRMVESGEEVTVTASAREDGQRPGYFAPQLSGTASTYAHKTAIKNLVALSEPGDDPDAGHAKPLQEDPASPAGTAKEAPEEKPAEEPAPAKDEKPSEAAPKEKPAEPQEEKNDASQGELFNDDGTNPAGTAPGKETNPGKDASPAGQEKEDARRQLNIRMSMWIKSQRERGCNDSVILEALRIRAREAGTDVTVKRYDEWLAIVGLKPDGSVPR